MKAPLSRLAPAAAAVLLLASCAPLATRPAGPFVQPLQTVRHGDADGYYRIGRYYQERMRYGPALDAYRKAVAANPAHVDALNGIGVIQSLQGHPGEAERAFEAALRIDPQAAHVLNNLGYHLLGDGKMDEAEAILQRAQAADPQNAGVRENLAQLQARRATQASAAAPAAMNTAVPAAMNAAAPAAMNAAVPAAVPAAAPAAIPAAAAPAAPGVATASHPTAAPPAESSAAPVAELAVASVVAEETRTASTQAPVASAEVSRPPAVAPTAPPPPLRVEVSNGHGATGLARNTSRMLPGDAKIRLTNHKPFGTQPSRIEYVRTAQEDARRVGALLAVPVPLAEVRALPRDASVRVLLGRDYPAVASASRVAVAQRQSSPVPSQP